mmetsp:Transcript_67557/g.161643  ORF Transcript_67557/g.161643 Transcript_67557/m.161643 type:complete len:218 (-) Transcript_67557:1153-1806(-)
MAAACALKDAGRRPSATRPSAMESRRAGASGTSRERSASPSTARPIPRTNCESGSAPLERSASSSPRPWGRAGPPFSTARYATRFTTSWAKSGASSSCTHRTASARSPESKNSSTRVHTSALSSSTELFAPAPQRFMMRVDECCSMRALAISRTSFPRPVLATRAGTSETNTGGRTSSTVARAMKRARSWAALGVSSATSSIDRSTRMNPSKNCSEP